MAGLQGPNQILDLLRALRRRRYQVAVPAVLVATLGIAFAVIVPKRYTVTTRVEIGEMRVEYDAKLKNPQSSAVRREVQSVKEHIENYQRVKEVLEANRLLWPEYVELPSDAERAQFIRLRILKGNLSAQTTTKDPSKGGTIFVDISFTDEDAARASKLLEELANSWLHDMIESDRNMLITERAELQDIIDAQETARNELEGRLYTLMKLLGKDPSSPEGRDGRRDDPGDWAFRALDKAKTDLSEVEFQMDVAEYELEQVRERLEKEPPTLAKPVTVQPEDKESLVSAKRAELDDLHEQISNKRPDNSTYKRLKPRIDELELELAELERDQPVASERWIEEPNPLIEEYQRDMRLKEDALGRLNEQRVTLEGRVIELEQETNARAERYRQLDDLRNDVSEARIALNDTRRTWSERDKALQMLDASLRPWRITQPPLPSSATPQPNPFLLSGVGVFLGLALGIGFALLSELARNCYRSVNDLAGVMSVPVLGAIETIVTRRERRRLQVSHAIAGLSTAVIVGTIGWITWLWTKAPERLPLEVQDAIEVLRTALK